MVGEVIQKKRKEAGFTQAQLAEMLGVTPPAVNRWEKNLSFPDATLLAPLARLLKTDINTLFSFYDTLSEAERDDAVSEARNKLLIEEETNALSFVDRIIKKNLADGALYKKLGDMLLGIHTLKKAKEPLKYLDRIAAYYERAMELSPKYSEELSCNLVTIYAELGEAEKAEAAWSRLPDNTCDKKWAHAEMQFLLKNNEAAMQEAKECVLRKIIELVTNLNFLRDTFLRNGDESRSDLTKGKIAELIDMFEIWNGMAVLCDVITAASVSDAASMVKDLSAIIAEKPVCKNISDSPLFEDVIIGGKTKKETDVADAAADVFYALCKKHGKK